jgi:RNA polymerase sigma-70 factor (ECF subfamily)
MTFYNEQTSEELTSFLGLSAANVRVIRHRALGRLRDCMSDRSGL